MCLTKYDCIEKNKCCQITSMERAFLWKIMIDVRKNPYMGY